MNQETTTQFWEGLQAAIDQLDQDSKQPLSQRLKGPVLRHFTKFPSETVPTRFRPQYRVLRNRLEDFSSDQADEGEESARQIERQLRALLESLRVDRSGEEPTSTAGAAAGSFDTTKSR